MNLFALTLGRNSAGSRSGNGFWIGIAVSLLSIITSLTAQSKFRELAFFENEASEPAADLQRVCGLSVNSRIVGGQFSKQFQWPWMVAILRSRENQEGKFSFSCGGSLLNRNFVLTAGHCVSKAGVVAPISSFRLRLGALEVPHQPEFPLPTDIGVSRVICHEGFGKKDADDDMGLLLMDRPAMYSYSVKPICLPTVEMAQFDFLDTRATIVGWGTTSYEGSGSSSLQHVEISVIGNRDCQGIYRSETTPAVISYKQLCAGVPEGGKDTCQGDSGGPLMKLIGNRWYLIGVVSYGFECAKANQPGIYSRATAYMDWIFKNTDVPMTRM